MTTIANRQVFGTMYTTDDPNNRFGFRGSWGSFDDGQGITVANRFSIVEGGEIVALRVYAYDGSVRAAASETVTLSIWRGSDITVAADLVTATPVAAGTVALATGWNQVDISSTPLFLAAGEQFYVGVTHQKYDVLTNTDGTVAVSRDGILSVCVGDGALTGFYCYADGSGDAISYFAGVDVVMVSSSYVPWVNHVCLAATGTGRNTETIDPNVFGGNMAVRAGDVFTPTVGNLLVVFAQGGVTSSTPSGWTLQTSAVSTSALYLWSLVAAGADTFTTDHNGDGSYPVIYDIYEFPAGTTIDAVQEAASVDWVGGTSPALSGLTTSNTILSAVSVIGTDPFNPLSFKWSAGRSHVQSYGSSFGKDTALGAGVVVAFSGTDVSVDVTNTTGLAGSAERVVMALTVSARAGSGVFDAAGAERAVYRWDGAALVPAQLVRS